MRFPDISVDGSAHAGVATINAFRISQSGWAETQQNVVNTIATLDDRFKPLVNVSSCIGVQNGAWLMLVAQTDGTIGIFHKFTSGTLHWESFEGSLTFPYRM